MLSVLFKWFFTQISQNSRIFSQARNHIIPVSSHLSVLSCDVAHRRRQAAGSRFQVPGSKPPPTPPRGSLVTPQAGRLIWKFQVPGSRFNAAHRRRQAAGSRFQVPGSKFKRRSIVYTPTIPHSYTPKVITLVTSHLSLLTWKSSYTPKIVPSSRFKVQCARGGVLSTLLHSHTPTLIR